jgi:cytidylate kinase
MREVDPQGIGKGHKDCMRQFRAAWDKFSADPARLTDFLRAKRNKRDSAERLRLMREMFLPRAEWVLSGSLQGWGDPVISYFDIVVFLYTPRDLRLKRLRAREASRFGVDAIAPGG